MPFVYPVKQFDNNNNKVFMTATWRLQIKTIRMMKPSTPTTYQEVSRA